MGSATRCPSPERCALLTCTLPWPQLLALVGIRKGLECIFSLHDLSWLDSIMPEPGRKEAEGKLPRKHEEEESDTEEVGDVLGALLFCCCPHGCVGAEAEPGLGVQLRAAAWRANSLSAKRRAQLKLYQSHECLRLGSSTGAGTAAKPGHGLSSRHATAMLSASRGSLGQPLGQAAGSSQGWLSWLRQPHPSLTSPSSLS